MSTLLPRIEINSSQPAKGSVIWLHGLGADGNDFTSIIPDLNLPNNLFLRFIFPHAPLRPVTLNQGYVMRAWFDISALRFDGDIDQRGIDESMKSIEALIEHEINAGIPASNIVLAGFSQGAMMALITALRYKDPLGGVLALSGCLPFADKLLQEAHSSHRSIPIFLAHGTEDTVVQYALDVATYDILKKNAFAVEWHSYPMGHGLCHEEIRDIGNWLKTVFDKT